MIGTGALRDRQVASGVIDLTRTTPPTPPFLAEGTLQALQDIARDGDLELLLRTHRWGGTEEDKTVGIRWLETRMPNIDPERLLVTNGVQNALLLVLRFLFSDHSVLLTEEHSYHGLRLIAETLGIEIAPVGMDEYGLDPESLAAACRSQKVRALYCMPTLQNPTARTMPAFRRSEITEIVRRYNVQIIEDDVYGSLNEDSPPPLATFAPELTWYANGYGKTVCAGLRVGYMYGPDSRSIAKLLDRFRTMSTWFPAPLHARLAHSWVSSGFLGRMLSFIRAEAKARQAVFEDLFPEDHNSIQTGALHVWLPMRQRRLADAFATTARSRGVQIRPSGIFSVGGEDLNDHVRVCLGGPASRDELADGLRILHELHYGPA